MSAINRRAAPRLVTTVLAIAALAVACGGATASDSGGGEIRISSPKPVV